MGIPGTNSVIRVMYNITGGIIKPSARTDNRQRVNQDGVLPFPFSVLFPRPNTSPSALPTSLSHASLLGFDF